LSSTSMASAACVAYGGTLLNCQCHTDGTLGESTCSCARDGPEVDVEPHATTVVTPSEEAKPEEVAVHGVANGSGISEIVVPQEPGDFEEIFEFYGAGTEHLRIMWERELKSFAALGDSETQLPADMRSKLLLLIGCLLQRLGAQLPKEWFKAVTILDVLTVRIPMPAKDLTVLCAAIVSILRKADKSEYRGLLENIAVVTNELAPSFRARDAEVQGVITEELIFDKELQVLITLGWQIDPPSCDAWISAFCARFAVLARGSLHPSVQWIWQNSIYWAQYICSKEPHSEAFSPRRLAHGILCISAIMAHVVSSEDLRPDQVNSQEWSCLFRALQPAVTMETQRLHWHLLSLLCSVNTNLESLKEDIYVVFMLMATMNLEYQRAP